MAQYIPFNEQDYQDYNEWNNGLIWYLTNIAENKTLTFSVDEVNLNILLLGGAQKSLQRRYDPVTNTYTLSIVSDNSELPYSPEHGLTYHVVEDVPELSQTLEELFAPV